MRTTYNLPDELVQQAMEASGAKTKREAVEWALRDFVRAKRTEQLIGMFGKTPLSLTADDLQRLRDMDMPAAPAEQSAKRPRARTEKATRKVVRA